MASPRKMSFREMVDDMQPWEKKVLIALVSAWAIISLIFWSCPICYAASPQYFPQGSTWTFYVQQGKCTTAIVNSVNYNCVAKGTYFQYGTSYLVPDAIFKNNFS